MPLSTDPLHLGLPEDTGIVMKEVDSSTAADGVFVFASAGLKVKYETGGGPYVARAGGILPGTDKTAALNTILAHADVSEVVLDSGQITIDATLTVPTGKKITLRNNARLIGTGTISGGIIDAPDDQHIFDTTLTVNPEAIVGGRFSAKWFGALGNGIVDDQPAIQKSVDTVIANNHRINRVYCPRGVYVCGAPIIMQKVNGSGVYQFHTVHLEGEASWWGVSGDQGTTFQFASKQHFGIGIQLGKGTKIDKIKIVGAFVPPATSGYAWYSTPFESFVTDGSKDTDTAVNAAIVIDPFSRTGIVPANFYAGFEDYYTTDGTSSNGGSTGVLVDDVMLFNFVAGIVCSINGQTRNAEQCRFERIQLGNMKAGFINCTDQEKMNVIDHVGAWSDVHTLFYGGGIYGSTIAGVYKVSNVNIAGRVNRFVYLEEDGYFSSHFDHIFSESMGSFGFIRSQICPSITNSEIGIARPTDETGAYPNWIIEGAGATFKNCSLRIYGLNQPITIKGSFAFENCKFEVAPFIGGYIDKYSSGQCTFLNCKTSASPFGPQTGIYYAQPAAGSGIYLAYGDYTIENPVRAQLGIKESIEFGKEYDLPYVFLNTSSTYAITVHPTLRTASFIATVADFRLFDLNKGVVRVNGSSEFDFMGIVTALNSGTREVTISYITPQTTNGTYALYLPHDLYSMQIVGDATSGSPILTNVELGPYSGTSTSSLIGKVIPTNLNPLGSGAVGFNKIIAAPSATSITLNSDFPSTVSDISFSVGTMKYKNTGTVALFQQANTLMTPGTIIEDLLNHRPGTSGQTVKAVVVQAGYPDNVTLGKTRKVLVRQFQEGKSSVRTTTTPLALNGKSDIYEIDTAAGNKVVDLPFLYDLMLAMPGATKTVRIVKVSSDTNTITINKHTTFADQPISGQDSVVLVNPYEFVDITFSITDVNPFTGIVTVTGRSAQFGSTLSAVSYVASQAAAGTDLEKLVILDTTSALVTYTINPATFRNRTFLIRGLVPASNVASVAPSSGTIEGNPSYQLLNGETITVFSDGTNLFVIGKN